MTTFEAILLGIIQGLTEFLPVSSSGHLELGQLLLGLRNLDQYVLFNLVCHLGTLFAIFFVFFEQIKHILLADRTRFLQIVLATLPLFPLVLIIKPIKEMFDQPQYLGFCFLLTAFLLYLGIQFGTPLPEEKRIARRWRDAFCIGLFQAMAILPGISRSGSTISGARLLGWGQLEAITFSFLLAIPAVFGGIALEILRLYSHTAPTPSLIGWGQYSAAFLTSFGVGYFSLRFLIRLASKDKFLYFVWYCVFIGVITLLYFWI